jgi:hypothetical protein
LIPKARRALSKTLEYVAMIKHFSDAPGVGCAKMRLIRSVDGLGFDQSIGDMGGPPPERSNED